jgi:hypothetical protein
VAVGAGAADAEPAEADGVADPLDPTGSVAVGAAAVGAVAVGAAAVGTVAVGAAAVGVVAVGAGDAEPAEADGVAEPLDPTGSVAGEAGALAAGAGCCGAVVPGAVGCWAVALLAAACVALPAALATFTFTGADPLPAEPARTPWLADNWATCG